MHSTDYCLFCYFQLRLAGVGCQRRLEEIRLVAGAPPTSLSVMQSPFIQPFKLITPHIGKQLPSALNRSLPFASSPSFVHRPVVHTFVLGGSHISRKHALHSTSNQRSVPLQSTKQPALEQVQSSGALSLLTVLTHTLFPLAHSAHDVSIETI